MVTDIASNKEQPLVPRCDRKRCQNSAQMFPILVIKAPEWSSNPEKKIEMELDVNVCPEHATERVKDFVDQDGWKQLCDNFAARRMPLPRRKDLSIIFRALEDRKFQ